MPRRIITFQSQDCFSFNPWVSGQTFFLPKLKDMYESIRPYDIGVVWFLFIPCRNKSFHRFHGLGPFSAFTWSLGTPSPLEQTVICDNLEVQALPGQTNPLQHLKLSSSSWKALHGFWIKDFLWKTKNFRWFEKRKLETQMVQTDWSWLMSSYRISSSPISYRAGNLWGRRLKLLLKIPSWMETAMKFQQHDYI